MSVNKQTLNQHLLWRAGFGIQPPQIKQLQTSDTASLYKEIVQRSSAAPSFINVITEKLIPDGSMYDDKKISPENRKALLKKSIEYIKKLNIAWLDEMVNSEAQLREKMSLLWHGHFACRTLNANHQHLLLHTIRTNALGNFGDLLKGVSKSAAMLQFLNNQQNRKQHPNENFAREVMELFTLGRGNYTEQDVKEAARAFTGWGFNMAGEFVFRDAMHDTGEKTFLGKKGNFNGDDILNILLEQKQTAAWITRKMYRYFINDIVDEDKAAMLAKNFYESNYNIHQLMNLVFTSGWFYEEKNIGARIKSPVELLAGIRRILPMQLQNPEVQLQFQKILGQALFYPPSVAGWPGGRNWIDSSTLMMRLRIPHLIESAAAFSVSLKNDDDTQMGMNANDSEMNPVKRTNINMVAANVDWNMFTQQFNNVQQKDLAATLQTVLLQTKTGAIGNTVFDNKAADKSTEAYIKYLTIALMSTPEYQMC